MPPRVACPNQCARWRCFENTKTGQCQAFCAPYAGMPQVIRPNGTERDPAFDSVRGDVRINLTLTPHRETELEIDCS